MKKQIICVLGLSLTAAMLLSGCSSSTTYGKYLKLGDYKGLEVSRIKTEVTDEELEEEMEYVLDENTDYTEVDRAAQDGDMVTIDYTATVGGEDFDGNSEEDLEIQLGEGYLEGYFLEAAEEYLVDMKAGETKNVTISVDEDYYDEELSGKDLDVELTLKTVSEVNRPELTDEFVASISDFDTVDAYKEDLRSNLMASKEENNQYTAGSDALQLVIANSTINGYPEELYDECKEVLDQTNQAYAEMLGLDVSVFEMSEEETKETVEEMVYEEMVITTIAEKEKLTVSDEEYTEYVESILEYYDCSSVEEFESYYDKDSTMDEILRTKVQDFLLENATVTEVSEDEYYSEFYEDDSYDGEEVIDLDMEEETDEVIADDVEAEVLDEETSAEMEEVSE